MQEAQNTIPIIRDGKTLLDGIRKNSLAPPQPLVQSSPSSPGGTPPLPQLKRYALSDTPPPAPGSNRPTSPTRKLRKNTEHSNSSTSIASTSSPRLVGAGRAPSPVRTRLNLDIPSSSETGGDDNYAGAPSSSKHPTTFAEMGFVGVKAESKECIIM